MSDRKFDKPKHSAAGLKGNLNAKKDGAGGKHTWGKVGDDSVVNTTNPKDPMYEDPKDQSQQVPQLNVQTPDA